MAKHTALYDTHQKLGAVMVDFAGWEMPLHYGSQIEEHHLVRKDAGMFDVSHMGVIDIEGTIAKDFLKYLLANNIDKLKDSGRALYSCILNHEGGVIDDLIAYYIAPEHYRLVVNAATKESDLQWMQMLQGSYIASHIDSHASGNSLPNSAALTIKPRPDFALIAVQGPMAREKVAHSLPEYQAQIENLKPFQFFRDLKGSHDDENQEWMIARTGYTGEDGLELIIPTKDAISFWQKLLQAEIHPAGLGARDTLRLEAGLNLYGQDMNKEVSPLESNLAWTVAFEPESRDFVGRKALEDLMHRGINQKLIGLVLLDKGILRHDQLLLKETDDMKNIIGRVTSGSFSPTLKKSIGLARITANIENECKVEIRGKLHRAQIVQLPFFRRTY